MATDNFTETLSEDTLDELDEVLADVVQGELADEDVLSLAFSKSDALALTEFLSYIAVTYGHLPMIAEQIILAVADWENGDELR